MKSLFSSKISIVLLSISLSLAILLGFSLQANLSIERPIKIIDLSTLSQEEVLAWATENQLTINTQDAYDENIPAGTILSQDVNVGERLFAGSSITITVSKGPDPEVLVNLVDFSGKDIGDVQTFIDANKLMNAKIEFEKSTKINSAFFIRQSIASGQIKRSDAISFYISTGDKDTLTTVVVPDFSTYTKQQITSWGSSSNIKINFIEEFNSTVEAGKVYEQSLAANAEVYDGSSITIKLSKGTGVVLENLVGKSKGEIDSFVKTNGLTVTYAYTYSGAQAKDIATTMSPAATTRVANGSAVNVTLSLGKVTIKDFTGKTLKELEAWIAEVNKQGANIKLTSAYTLDDKVASGNMINQSPKSGDSSPGFTITASVSKGSGIVVGTFSADTTQEGLKVSKSYVYNSKSANSVISQDPAAGAKVEPNTTVYLVVSLGNTISLSDYGSTFSSLQGWVNDKNSKGASITLNGTETNSSSASGTLLSVSPSGSVSITGAITASYSKCVFNVTNYEGQSAPSSLPSGYSKTEAYSSTVDSGKVISQSPNSGTVNCGGSVVLTVSKGQDPATQPIYLPPLAPMVATSTTGYNYTVTYLTKYLGDLGFTNFGFTAGNYSISSGQVNKQNLDPGTYARNIRIEIEVQQ